MPGVMPDPGPTDKCATTGAQWRRPCRLEPNGEKTTGPDRAAAGPVGPGLWVLGSESELSGPQLRGLRQEGRAPHGLSHGC